MRLLRELMEASEHPNEYERATEELKELVKKALELPSFKEVVGIVRHGRQLQHKPKFSCSDIDNRYGLYTQQITRAGTIGFNVKKVPEAKLSYHDHFLYKLHAHPAVLTHAQRVREIPADIKPYKYYYIIPDGNAFEKVGFCAGSLSLIRADKLRHNNNLEHPHTWLIWSVKPTVKNTIDDRCGNITLQDYDTLLKRLAAHLKEHL